MTIADQLHKSKSHREGFDPNCPRCLSEDGITGIIGHLKACERRNRKDAGGPTGPYHVTLSKDGAQAEAVANEQKRMIGILSLYRKVAA